MQAPSRKKSKWASGDVPKGARIATVGRWNSAHRLRFIQEHIKRLLQQIGDAFKVVYFIFDGELGHNDAMQMVRQVGLHLVSKLRHNSALYFPYDGPYAGRGPRRKYGTEAGLSEYSVSILAGHVD